MRVRGGADGAPPFPFAVLACSPKVTRFVVAGGRLALGAAAQAPPEGLHPSAINFGESVHFRRVLQQRGLKVQGKRDELMRRLIHDTPKPVREKKDPLAPKRPLSAFFLFMQDERERTRVRFHSS